MNYHKIYYKLITRAENRTIYDDYIEVHHIIPRSDGGNNKKENKVELTPKEHHLAHLCLIRMNMCTKYCFRDLNLIQYINMKHLEKKKFKRHKKLKCEVNYEQKPRKSKKKKKCKKPRIKTTRTSCV